MVARFLALALMVSLAAGTASAGEATCSADVRRWRDQCQDAEGLRLDLVYCVEAYALFDAWRGSTRLPLHIRPHVVLRIGPPPSGSSSAGPSQMYPVTSPTGAREIAPEQRQLMTRVADCLRVRPMQFVAGRGWPATPPSLRSRLAAWPWRRVGQFAAAMVVLIAFARARRLRRWIAAALAAPGGRVVAACGALVGIAKAGAGRVAGAGYRMIAHRWLPRIVEPLGDGRRERALQLWCVAALAVASYTAVSFRVYVLFPFCVFPMYSGASAGSVTSKLLVRDASHEDHEITDYVGWSCDQVLDTSRPTPTSCSEGIYEPDFDPPLLDYVRASRAPGDLADSAPVEVIRRIYHIARRDLTRQANGGTTSTIVSRDCVLAACRAVRKGGHGH